MNPNDTGSDEAGRANQEPEEPAADETTEETFTLADAVADFAAGIDDRAAIDRAALEEAAKRERDAG